MQVKIDAAAAEADFAAVLAELEADQGDSVSEEAAQEAPTSEGDPEADETESEETEEEIEETEAAEPAPDAEALREELAELLDSGDLKGLAEKLGKDPSIFKLNNKQFKAARVALRDAQRREASALNAKALADSAKADVDAKAKRAEDAYGPIYQGFQAYKQGDPTGVRAAIEHMTGDKFENVVGAIARAAKGLDPGQIEVIKLRKELAERDAKAAQEKDALTARQVEQQDLATITGRLAGTSLEGIEGAAADIAKVLRASVDPRTGKPLRTLKEAFTEVKTAYAKRAAELSRVVKKPAAPPAKPSREPLVQRKVPPAGQKKLTAEQEFAKELELAKRDTAAAERKTRRVR